MAGQALGANPDPLRSTVITAAVIGLWYSSNIGVLLLNKYLLSNTGFYYPIFLTMCHMMACATIGGGAALLRLPGLPPFKALQSRVQGFKVLALAAVFCISVVMGNASLKFIPVSFNQAIGSTTPFFTAILAYVMQGTRESHCTYYTLIPIIVGVVVASGGEPAFNIIGFMCCLVATSLRALKSVVQGILMTDPSEKLDAMSLLFYMSTFSVGFLLPVAGMLEPAAFGRCLQLARGDHTFILWLVGNSSLAYVVNLTNFLVTKYTSALTLQVLGNAKGVVAAVVSVAVFRNAVTWTGCVGYGITVAGVFLYSESKRRAKLAKEAAVVKGSINPKEGKEIYEPLLTDTKVSDQRQNGRADERV